MIGTRFISDLFPMQDLSHRTEEILELARIGLRVRLQRDAVFLRVWDSLRKRQNWGLYPHLTECIGNK